MDLSFDRLLMMMLHLVGCLYYYINDARSRKHQIYFEGLNFSLVSPNLQSALTNLRMTQLTFLKEYETLFFQISVSEISKCTRCYVIL